MQSFDHVVLQGHVTNKSHRISIAKVPVVNELGRLMTFIDGILPIVSHDHLITKSCEKRSSLRGGGSASKRLSRHRLLVPFLYSKSGRTDQNCLSNFLHLLR